MPLLSSNYRAIVGSMEKLLGKRFAEAGCRGTLTALEIDGPGRVSYGGDEPMCAASTFKVAVALELFCQGMAGVLDLTQRVRLQPEDRTDGGQGFSLFEDAVEVSLRDAALMMLTVSDNTATDAVIRRIGSTRVQERLDSLGLTRTVFTGTWAEHIDGIGRELGFADYAGIVEASHRLTGPALAELEERYFAAPSLQPGSSPSTTAEDMARLMRMVWRDEAGPAEACELLRAAMGKQNLIRGIATGFGEDVRVAAKSGGVGGLVTNDVGVVQLPDGRRYAVAVFTRAIVPGRTERAPAMAAIGAAARLAVEYLGANQTRVDD